MKVSNLLFSAPMVRAIIREIERPGTGKTQTRRTIEPERGDDIREGDILISWPPDAFIRQGARFRPRFRVGDLIYVREAWRVSRRWDSTKPSDLPPKTMSVYFDAGGFICNVATPNDWRPTATGEAPEWAGKKRRGMFLPRWASRLTLEVTDVRVERLCGISGDDAKAEGVFAVDLTKHTSVARFKELWNGINGDRPGLAWKYNPWVVAISFRPHLINIDAYLERIAP